MKYTLTQIMNCENESDFNVMDANRDYESGTFDGVEGICFIYDDKTPSSGYVVVVYY